MSVAVTLLLTKKSLMVRLCAAPLEWVAYTRTKNSN